MGILLGIPNFYSIYFLMMALNNEMSGSVFFPTLNCSVIALSSLLGIYLFKEKLRDIHDKFCQGENGDFP